MHEQCRADEQDAGEGELGDHQSVAEPAMPAAATRFAARVLQPFAEPVRRDLQRGRQTKEHARSDRRQQGEGKCFPIDPNAFQKRQG